MTCKACGYSDVKDVRVIPVQRDLTPPNGSSGLFKGLLFSDGAPILYACPVCGTVKMEVEE